jgi:hypothetical protein
LRTVLQQQRPLCRLGDVGGYGEPETLTSGLFVDAPKMRLRKAMPAGLNVLMQMIATSEPASE